MPIYEFVCMSCESHFEELLRLDDGDPDCPDCGSREDAPPAFRVRGSRHRRATELRRILRRRMLRRGLWLRILTH